MRLRTPAVRAVKTTLASRVSVCGARSEGGAKKRAAGLFWFGFKKEKTRASMGEIPLTWQD